MGRKITKWSLLDDDELRALEDALCYASTAFRNNYGAGYDRNSPEDREARTVHRLTEKMLEQVSRELGDRDQLIESLVREAYRDDA